MANTRRQVLGTPCGNSGGNVSGCDGDGDSGDGDGDIDGDSNGDDDSDGGGDGNGDGDGDGDDYNEGHGGSCSYRFWWLGRWLKKELQFPKHVTIP